MIFLMSMCFYDLVDMDTFKAFLGSSDVSPVALMAIRTFIYLYQSIYGQMQR